MATMTRNANLAIRIAILGAAVLCAAAAPTSLVTCSFTEPFVRTVYDAHRRTLTATFDVAKRAVVQRNMTTRVVSPTVFEVLSENQQVIQHLELSHHGSDGMSDRTYPYEAQWTPHDDTLPDTLVGGCE